MSKLIPQAKPRPHARKRVVLVIDDSLDMLELLRTIFEIDDYDILTAQTGHEAFKVLSKVKKPDLILLDVRMQEMTGPDFLRLLEEKRPDVVKQVPVVLLTALEADLVPQGKAVGFLRKPIEDVNIFLRKARQFIEMGTHGPRLSLE